MIVNNAAARRDVDFWTKHLENTEANERAELKEIRGLRADTLREALEEMQRLARINPRVENFMYHADFNPCPHEHLTAEQRDRAFEIFEQQRGIPPDAARVVMEHVKNGRQHWHVIWYRLNEQGRPFSDRLDAKVAHVAARKIEEELNLERVISPLTREPGTPRPPRAPKPWEMYRGDQTGLDPRDVTAEVTSLREQADTGRAFQAALEQHGYQLVTGNRGLLILDSAGKEHSLAKRSGMTMKELNAFLHDVDRAALSTVEQGKELYQQRKISELEADRETVRYEIEWEEKLAQAAIEKEKVEGRFIEPQPEGVTRMYRGIGHNVWPLGKGDAVFFSTDPTRAAQFGTLHYVDVTAAEMAKFERPHPPRILEQEPIAQNDWRTADPAILARLKPLESARTEAQAKEQQRQEQERETRAGGQEKQTTPPRGLNWTHAQIWVAYHQPGRNFRDALEDQGLFASVLTQPEADRLNRWERQRRKELGLELPAQENGQTAEQRRAEAWFAQTGGLDQLTPDLREQAQASYDQWNGDKARYGLGSYVSYVQRREAERREQETPGQEQAAPQKERYQAGELVIVNPYGDLYQLSYRNTGATQQERAERLREIDPRTLLSVSAAQNVMGEVHRQRREEREQLREQHYQDQLRQVQGKHWPILPPTPERKRAGLFQQAAQEAARDHRTEKLTGVAAHVWELFKESDSRKAFAAALEDQGIGFAVATKDEAERSHKEAKFARAVGHYTPRLKAGEIVLVTTPRLEFHRNGEMVEPRRVHKIDQAIAAKFLKGLALDRRELGSIEATQQKLDIKAQERQAERDVERMNQATWIRDMAPEGGRKTKILEPIVHAGKIGTQVIEAGIDAAANLATAAFSILDPPTTPAQRAQAAENSREEREAQAQHQTDFTRFTSDHAQQGQNHQEQQAARDRQRESERDRF